MTHTPVYQIVLILTEAMLKFNLRTYDRFNITFRVTYEFIEKSLINSLKIKNKTRHKNVFVVFIAQTSTMIIVL